MVVGERARHELFGRLEDVLGTEHAVTLMEHLPPVGWADVVTKHDLSTEIGLLRQELSAEIGLVRRDLAALDKRLDLRVDGLSQELRTEISSVRQEITALFRAELSSALTAQTKTLMFTVLGALTSMTALLLAAGRI
jgi:hypothetical protein